MYLQTMSDILYSGSSLIFSAHGGWGKEKDAAEFPKTPSPKPARIPPQTPPAGGKSAEAGRIHSPRQIVSPCQVRFNHFRFRFLDLCIRFGKIISKVCEGFNSGAPIILK